MKFVKEVWLDISQISLMSILAEVKYLLILAIQLG